MNCFCEHNSPSTAHQVDFFFERKHTSSPPSRSRVDPQYAPTRKVSESLDRPKQPNHKQFIIKNFEESIKESEYPSVSSEIQRNRKSKFLLAEEENKPIAGIPPTGRLGIAPTEHEPRAVAKQVEHPRVASAVGDLPHSNIHPVASGMG